jgi:hypothetical protein
MTDTPNHSKDILVILPSGWNRSLPSCKTALASLSTSQAKTPFSFDSIAIPELSYAFIALFITIGATIYTSKGQTT